MKKKVFLPAFAYSRYVVADIYSGDERVTPPAIVRRH